MTQNGKILKANNSFKKMVNENIDSNAIIGKFFTSYISEEDLYKIEDSYIPFLKDTKKSLGFNIKYKSKDGYSWWKLNLDKVKSGNDIFIFGVVVDIGDEIDFQGNLIEAKQAAERSEASKSIFLANMSHEIRTPIHTVTGLSELLVDTNLDSEQREYVSQIEFAAKVLLTLINDILDFSKIEAGKLVFENIEYNLYETINNSVDLSALEAHKKGVDVIISMDKDMPITVWGDQVRMRQVIVNLMSNAVKFTQKGQIVLNITTKIIGENKVNLRISVEDSGIGISKEKQKKLFMAFSQADASTTRQFGGTGLGLSISSSLVQMMGGIMQVTSDEGRGSKFYFEIPVEIGDYKSPYFSKPPIENLKALVVDDNPIVNNIFSNILRAWDYDVVEVYSGPDAIKELISQSEIGKPYDICFIDQILPGMDGWQLAGEIHSSETIKRTKTFLMSLKGKGIEESKMKLLGWFQGYLTKPVSSESLYNALINVYDHTIDENSFDDVEELEECEVLDDDDFLEPLSFSEYAYDDIELLHPIKIVSNILVVEDHIVNQKLFRLILEKLGYNIFLANDGKEAIDVVEKEDIDLVFMDCQMPIMNGYDSARSIREKGYKLPIIAVTASAVKGEYEKCINAGMSDVMTKPFKKEDVVKSLSKWLEEEELL